MLDLIVRKPLLSDYFSPHKLSFTQTQSSTKFRLRDHLLSICSGLLLHLGHCGSLNSKNIPKFIQFAELMISDLGGEKVWKQVL